MLLRFIVYLFMMLLLPAGSILSQNIYGNFHENGYNANLKAGDYKVQLHNNYFLKNNEYFGAFTKGITYIGYVLQPEIKWALHEKIFLSAEWYFRQFLGQKGFNATLPIVSLRFDLSWGLRVNFGRLSGNLHHQYHEAIYGSDNYFSKQPEVGIQLLLERKKFKSDLWLHCEKFILPGDKNQEIFNGGLIAQFNNKGVEQPYGLSLHFQGVISHKGGQQIQSNSPVMTRANIAGGLQYGIQFNTLFMRRLTLAGYYLQSHEMSTNNLIPFDQGFGLASHIAVENDWSLLSFGWFHGAYFFASLGDYLFQSLNRDIENYTLEDRSLLTAKLLLKPKAFEIMDIGVRFESYYDVVDNNFDFSYGINFALNTDILIGSRRKK